MRVLLIDDHELMWNGTRRLLETLVAEDPAADELEFRAVGSVEKACALPDHSFDLILLDYHLPGHTGLEALKVVRSRFDGASVCILSAESGSAQIRGVLDEGAAGFVPKSYSEVDIGSALRLVLRHKVYAPMEFLITEEVVRSRSTCEVRSEDLAQFLRLELSPRQREVLSLAMQGLPNKTISRRLQIAEGTVKHHLSLVYRALGVGNRTGALIRVLQAGAADALEAT